MMTRAFSMRALLAALAGLPGVLALPFLAPLPPGIPPLLAMVNPALLMCLMAVAGAWAAPRLGLAFLSQRGEWLALWAAAGLLAGLGVALLDAALAPFWAGPGMATLRDDRGVAAVILGILYGGMTEEVIFRWGLLSLLALGLGRVLPRGVALGMAAGVAALAFALAHLPAVAMMAEGVVTPALILRTVLWNGLLGLIYGAAFLRGGLVAAMLAHGATHPGFALAAL